jgi:hypothetical protein
MTSDRGNCSPSSGLFLEEDVPVLPPSKPVRESRATITLFPRPVPIIPGHRRGPTTAARASATILANNYSVMNYNCYSINSPYIC